LHAAGPEKPTATRPEPGRAERLTAADPEQVRGALGQIDRGVAGHLLLGMQQGQGNAYVSRMVAGSQQLARDKRRRPPPKRPVAETMLEAADTAEAAGGGDFEVALPKYRSASIAEEAKRIKEQADAVRADQVVLQQALEAKAKEGTKDKQGRTIEALGVKPEMKQENESAIRQLDRITDTTQNNSGTLEAFQAELGNLDRDHARLLAQMTGYASSKKGAGTFTTSVVAAFVEKGEGAAIGERMVASTGIAAGEFRATATGKDNPVAAHQGRSEAARRQMDEKSASIGNLYGEFRAQQDATRAKLHAIDKVVAEEKIDATQDKIAKLRDRSNATRDMISQIGGLVSNILGFSGWVKEPLDSGKPSGDTRSSAGNIFTGAMMIAFDLVNREENKRLDEQIKGLETELKGFKATKHESALMEALDGLNRERQLLRIAANKVVNAQGALEQAQHDYRQSMSDMGAAADKGGKKGGDRFEVIAQLLSEADAFGAQARVVGDLGQQYLHDAGGTGSSTDNPGQTVKHWKLTVREREKKVLMVGPGKPLETWISTWRQTAAANGIRSALKELQVQRDEIAELAAELREVFESRAGAGATDRPAAGAGR
jgi:hypothetical protein